jgi:hypothetical protein
LPPVSHSREAEFDFSTSIATGIVSGQQAREGEKNVKKICLTIILAIGAAFVVQQPALAKKSHKGSASRTSAANKKHKKHMKKAAVATPVQAIPA